jgi:hypothetical protein
MERSKIISFLSVLIFSVSCAYAQNTYEADTDSAWIASQNGGSTELSNGSDEPNAACIGDGCDGTETFPAQDQQATSGQASANGATTDSTAGDSTKVAKADSSDYEDCTPADSLLKECKDDEDDTYDRYLNENAEMYRARKEGFARKISLGFRAAGGMNMVFGKKAGNWEIGYEGSAGIFAKMPFFSRLLTLYPELDFDYRVFKFESESDYSKDEASITQMLFEIPILFVFAPDNEGFFVGIGPDLGLKLSSKSKYKQEVDTGKKIEKDKRKNTLPTAGVLLGGAFDIGYAFNSHFTVDIRVVQYLSNLVNEKAVAETEIMDSKLYTFHTTLGISFAL